MNNLNRRNFVKGSGVALLGASLGINPSKNTQENKLLEIQRSRIQFTRDGLDFSPLEYVHELKLMAENNEIETDYYSNGGTVAKLEETFASLLGKRKAVFMPTGTLANHLAIRSLAGQHRRVIVQADSHIYRDSGDCAQTLSQLNLIPINPGKVNFSLDDVKEIISATKMGRVDTRIGTISIESPVRRHLNKMFDFNEMVKISEFARDQGIGMHLDGARLFNACFHSGKTPKEFSEIFDTVYISLYKNFNAPSGAILVGNDKFLDSLYHMRRMFGGGMPQVWPFAAIALKFARLFLEEYRQANAKADHLFKLLNESQKFEAQRIKDGTNVFELRFKSGDPQSFRNKLNELNINIPTYSPEIEGFYLKINPTLNRMDTKQIAKAFINCS